MAKKGTPGSYLELQAASDIFFVVVEIYREENLEKPFQIIRPLRSRTTYAKDGTRRIKIRVENNNHCAVQYSPEDLSIVNPFAVDKVHWTKLGNLCLNQNFKILGRPD